MLRSLIFAPGNQERKVEKALGLGADAVAIDLEDAVPQDEKQRALEGALRAIDSNPAVPLYVRVNGLGSGRTEAELSMIARPGLAGVILPMVESAADLAMVDAQLSTNEPLARKEGKVALIPTIESCKGLSSLREILKDAPERVGACNFGAWDYSRDARIVSGEHEEEFAYARSKIVTESRAAGLPAPIDSSFVHLGDLEGLKQSCGRAKRMGFAGKACIHPEQIAIVNEMFSATEDELAHAREIVSAMKDAAKEGSAAVRVRGRFVDEPMLEQARDLLEQFG